MIGHDKCDHNELAWLAWHLIKEAEITFFCIVSEKDQAFCHQNPVGDDDDDEEDQKCGELILRGKSANKGLCASAIPYLHHSKICALYIVTVRPTQKYSRVH